MNKKYLLLLITILVLIVSSASAVLFFKSRGVDGGSSDKRSDATNVIWQFDRDTGMWQSNGIPLDCPEPLTFPSPVDVSLASGIIYPGQVRGGDYKPHGGFRFDNRDTNDVELRASMDGNLVKASKYLESGEEQIMIFYIHDCGIMVMHDHLLTLSAKLAHALSNIPVGKEGDSRTTTIEPPVRIEKGEVLATEIGHKNFNGQKNISVDFGLYDLRKTNGVNYNSAFRAQHPNITEYGTYAVCWFDYLSAEEERIVRNLPAGGHEGKVSDYCEP